MVWTRRVQVLRSDTKASANSIANTAVFSASHRCGIFGPFTHRALRHWSRSVIGKPCRIVCSGMISRLNLKLGTENGATGKGDAIPCRDTFGTSDAPHGEWSGASACGAASVRVADDP